MNLEKALTRSTLAAHLTAEQLDSQLSTRSIGSSKSEEDHLLECDLCAEELSGLRNSISLFRQASSSYANQQLRTLAPIKLPERRLNFSVFEPSTWAAAALLLAALLPLQTLHRHASPVVASAPSMAAALDATPTQSKDEALLEDVDRDMAAPVPASMRVLADPTADNSTSLQNSTQRKD
jgi:hypothetical protein